MRRPCESVSVSRRSRRSSESARILSIAVKTSSATSPPLVSIVKTWISGTSALPGSWMVVVGKLVGPGDALDVVDELLPSTRSNFAMLVELGLWARRGRKRLLAGHRNNTGPVMLSHRRVPRRWRGMRSARSRRARRWSGRARWCVRRLNRLSMSRSSFTSIIERIAAVSRSEYFAHLGAVAGGGVEDAGTLRQTGSSWLRHPARIRSSRCFTSVWSAMTLPSSSR